ncbi:MAG: tRNA epoxyqueuosine(34) reductase QueG [Gammaproteobacteria bacterium]|nr:tRNA epoxyqueuosine(34) reductase QueG [Gammaproteobacteria bacterium]
MITTDTAREDATGSLAALAVAIRAWARELGFPSLGICGTDLSPHDERLREWVAQGLHGELDYMARHGAKRWRPEELLPGTLRVISVRMDYHRADSAEPSGILNDAERAYVSRYALGRDYHKLMRARLARLADRILAARPGSAQRVFVDSAPVLERGVAQKAGLGWIGKNTLLIDPRAGSWFFLGEIYTDIPLPLDAEFSGMHCGSCTACLDVCPTAAFVSPFVLDARRCISYLTIELQGAIPHDLRPLIGNRVFGCDDCQLVCPWNKFAQPSCEADFAPRHGLDAARLTELFAWSAEQFAERAAGTPLYRLGHERWLRNLAVALGNGPATDAALAALRARSEHPSELVREHVTWAIDQLATRSSLAGQNGSAP